MAKYFTKVYKLDGANRVFLPKSMREQLDISCKDTVKMQFDMENSRIIMTKAEDENLSDKEK